MIVQSPTTPAIDRARNFPLLIFAGLFTSQILFLAVAFLLYGQGFATNADPSEIFLIVADLVSLGSMAAGFMLYSLRMKRASTFANEDVRFRSRLSAMTLRLHCWKGRTC